MSANAPITTANLDAEAQLAHERLFQARRLWGKILVAKQMIDQGGTSDAFVGHTMELYRELVSWQEKQRNRPSASRFVALANADHLISLKLPDWTANTAHDAADYILQDLLCAYDIGDWDEREERSSKPYPERKRIEDCNRVAKWCRNLTGKILDEIDATIDAEKIRATRWLMDRAPKADEAPRNPAKPGGRPTKWGDLLALIQENNAEHGVGVDQKIANRWNSLHAAEIKAGTRERIDAGKVRKVRYDYKNRGKKTN
jgi:hypothetical protein